MSSVGPSILIVGAGCVGKVFALHLARSGARVTFLVRPTHRERGEEGFALAQLRMFRAPRATLLSGVRVVSEPQVAATERFDQVYLTMSSAAVRGAWLPELLDLLGPTTLVSLQPDAADHALVAQAWQKPGALVCGAIGFIAFDAPLPEQRDLTEPVTAYWLPPLGRSLFSGPRHARSAVVAQLRKGGLPASSHRDVNAALAFPNAIGMTYLVALEACGWSPTKLRDGSLRRTCEAAVREAIALVRAEQGRAPVGIGLAANTGLSAFGFALAERVTPFPLLPYLQKHFTKVSAQTRLIVRRLVERGAARGQPVAALGALLEALPQAT